MNTPTTSLTRQEEADRLLLELVAQSYPLARIEESLLNHIYARVELLTYAVKKAAGESGVLLWIHDMQTAHRNPVVWAAISIAATLLVEDEDD